MGTWTILSNDKADSRSISLATPGQEHSYELTYVVQWVPSSGSDPYPGEGGLLSAVASMRQRLPSGLRTTSFLKTFVLRGIDHVAMREQAYTWEVRARYGSFYPMTEGYVSLTRQAGTRQAPYWRLSPTVPSNGDVTWPAGVVDIGGTKVDTTGNPVTYEIPQMTIQLEVLWDRTGQNAYNAAGEPPTSLYAGKIGTRNSNAFLGCDIGTLVYRGFSISPSYEWYRIQHTWLWDQLFHLEQIPMPIPTGAPRCETATTIAGVSVFQASSIGFFQKYPTKSDHSTLLSAANLSEITSPVPASV